MRSTKYIELVEYWNSLNISFPDKLTEFYLSGDPDAEDFAREMEKEYPFGSF